MAGWQGLKKRWEEIKDASKLDDEQRPKPKILGTGLARKAAEAAKKRNERTKKMMEELGFKTK